MIRGAQGDVWRAVFDGLLEAVWLVDPQTLAVRFANRGASALLGRSAETMEGADAVELLACTPEDLYFWAQDRDALLRGIHSHSGLLGGDGEFIAVDRRVSRVDSPSGEALLLVTMIDRREQASTERELEILLSELRATLDSAADGMLVYDMGGRMRAFNQRLAQLWGMPDDLLVQRNDAAVVAHMQQQVADADAYRARLSSIALEPDRDTTDILHLRNGTIIERRSVPQLSQGRPVGRVFSFRDVTLNAQAQASLRLAARVFDSSLDAIFIADDRHQIVRMNPSCERLIGAPAVALHGAPAVSLFGAEGSQVWLDRVLAAWERDGFWEGELHLPEGRSDGAVQPSCAVHLSWVVLRSEEGNALQSIGFMRDLTQQHAARSRIEELAYSDVLTGLPNRLRLSRRVGEAFEAIQGARSETTGFAILFVDLDRFKIINDSLGHLFGDRVLQIVAQRLQGCLRQSDMLCRLGGDEFVVYLHGGDAAVAEGVARRMLEDMLRPFMLDGMGFSIQCSIGVALYPQDGETLDDLIKQADTAMYRVKERGRGSYGFYQPQMNADLLSRMKLEHAMRQALGQQRMVVHYQPQVAMSTGGVVGAEALLRWNDPELGPVSPGVFIPLAEESGYIITLGSWVMEQAVQEAARWLRSGSPLVMAVNVSALEFRQPDFVERLTRLLVKHGLPATLLELELTETILLQDAQEMEQRLVALAELGIGLAIDDFGTGYSSLAYLKKLAIHKLKIDQSFVRGLPDDDGDRAIINAIVHMGRALHIEVVAEGVETQAQRVALEQMDCRYFQGFLCAPALPAEEFRRLLASRQNYSWAPSAPA
ncbi:PAS domain S-box-containing protein/diguanylate cyclase (GGDEF) domain-containing protein [Paracidovorax valerianellae]|uniref:PAS domain S-box-containing protein/diguanylate cyclase (GGDEF) domain-containing protein n=1 Tax=Paracidovorax valerianellae TaxID=187868 RepID=A0A1G7C4G2_9BURK|nr:EAL domain-containing protein [Paracidovorax valerianellae]MDA8446574.1 EAL domain-containing protein [Paracidovorax valerianellae]SDE34187.1 PAS domain S-box-containing protein/diguanylate cyclase (GGDEF) domain-containing protein [Paracidovorax valerianellae]